jgi:RNA polymerase sigma-70 factor (TIGR02960 family)
VTWLEPYPDDLLEGLADAEPGPEARYQTHEAISLAFITAVQLLPPRQRAVLILRDVLGFAADEAARILGSTEESVTSALKRARATMRHRLPHGPEPPPVPGSANEKQLIDRLTHAYETGDVDSIIALFTDDAWLTMPPAPLEYQGRDLIARFLTAISFRDGRTYRLIPTRANGQLAFGAYLREAEVSPARRAAFSAAHSVARMRCSVAAVTGDPAARCWRVIAVNIACTCAADSSASSTFPR